MKNSKRLTDHYATLLRLRAEAMPADLPEAEREKRLRAFLAGMVEKDKRKLAELKERQAKAALDRADTALLAIIRERLATY